MTSRDQSASAGLLPVQGTYADVRIGSLIQGRKGTNDDVWEIVDMRHPAQFDYKTTPWFLAANVATGEQASIPPKTSSYPCMFMVPEETVDPDVEKPKLDVSTVGDPSPLSDGPAVALLVETLGARVIATQDNDTGVWHCKPYEQILDPKPGPMEFIDHLEVAHGLDLSGLDTSDPVAMVTTHGAAHAKTFTGAFGSVGGFPHVHDYKAPHKPFGDIK